MKLIKISPKLKTWFLTKFPDDAYLKSVTPLGILVLVAACIWVGGPYLTWQGYTPFLQPEKRIYIILFLFLIWLLKFLLLDLENNHSLQNKNLLTKKKLKELQNRFEGALSFLKKTTISRHGQPTRLYQLPWHLVIGPINGGKTTLLAKSGVNFVLQRQFPNQPDLVTSENCDWWITQDANLIDVPGQYLSIHDAIQNHSKTIYPALWRYFLRLIKKKCGKNSITSIIIVLPLPEVMQQGDPKKYQLFLRDLFQRLYEFQKLFPQPLPCQLIVSKCDLLPGFNEFFAESGDDEIGQAWGVTAHDIKNNEKLEDLFALRFDALIKKLNQQLLWRLHQERNPMARPYIKDFPLQVERMKEYVLDFIKKLSATHFPLSLRGIYLTSAMQNNNEIENDFFDDPINTTQRAVQIFKAPTPATRAYFIKQFLTQGLISKRVTSTPVLSISAWKRRSLYAASIGVILFATFLLGHDFARSIKKAYSIQNNFSEYQLVIQQPNDPDDHLLKTLNLLNTLQHTAKNIPFKANIYNLFTFYSDKTELKANEVYHQSLRTVLIPEIKSYFEEYLRDPINKNAEYVYGVLKAYLMLGNNNLLDNKFVYSTLREILPKSTQAKDVNDLITHLSLAFKLGGNPLPLNADLIQKTRKYLTSIPSLQLSYIILKNIDNNNTENEINLGLHNSEHPVFAMHQISNQVPNMFTAKAFATIDAQETTTAAQEAIMGNWVLGTDFGANKNPDLAPALVEQLRTTYINNYIDVWESLLANIHLANPTDLVQADAMIVSLISNNSPLLQLLQTLHDNTYFEPITTSSPKLLNLGLLLDKNSQSENLLYQIFSSLQSVHQYLQSVITADNEKKAAFDVVSRRMQNTSNTPDEITQLRLIAQKSPDPLKNWLGKISNNTWHFLMQDASRYINTAWQDQVAHTYQFDIANRYPFSTHAREEVTLDKFIDFFGTPGIVASFYNTYLQPFVDTSTSNWQLKVIDDKKLPMNEDTLRQIQQALLIHQIFFPSNDNKPYIQFALQPFKLSKNIKSVKLSFNDNQFVDESYNFKDTENNEAKNSHVVVWPGNNALKLTSVRLVMANKQIIARDYPGEWGWLKLVNQSFENSITKKEILLNLSVNEHSAKYLLMINGQTNPFFALNLQHFYLPPQLITN